MPGQAAAIVAQAVEQALIAVQQEDHDGHLPVKRRRLARRRHGGHQGLGDLALDVGHDRAIEIMLGDQGGVVLWAVAIDHEEFGVEGGEFIPAFDEGGQFAPRNRVIVAVIQQQQDRPALGLVVEHDPIALVIGQHDVRDTVTGFENQSDERVVLILHEGTIELDDSGRGEGLPFTVSLNDASLSGSTTFSLDRGLILSSATKTEQVMTMSMPAAGMRQRIRTESSTVLELVGPVTGRKRGGPIAPEADGLMSVTDLAELPRGPEIGAPST